MRPALLIAVCLPVTGCVSDFRQNTSLLWPDEKTSDAAQALAFAAVDSPQSVRRDILLKGAMPVSASFETTTKGNGFISVPGLSIRVYDFHNDGLIFDNGLLACQWEPTPSSPYPQLRVSGVAILFDEKGDHEVGRVPVAGVFRLSAHDHAYRAVTCSPEIYYWTDAVASSRPRRSLH